MRKLGYEHDEPDHIRLFDTFHLAIPPNAFFDDCGVYEKVASPTWIFCRLHCAISLNKITSLFVLLISIFSVPFLFIFLIFLFRLGMADEIQPVTVGSGADVATDAVVRNGDGKRGELVIHSRCQD